MKKGPFSVILVSGLLVLVLTVVGYGLWRLGGRPSSTAVSSGDKQIKEKKKEEKKAVSGKENENENLSQSPSPAPSPDSPDSPDKKNLGKAPASVAPPSLLPLKEKFFFQGRELVGPGILTYAQNPVASSRKLKFLNHYNSRWEKILKKELRRFQPPGTKIVLIKEKSLIEIFENRGKYIETVLVQTIRPNGKTFSYRAQIDSGSGEILRTWDRTIHERRQVAVEGLTPTGTL